MSKPTLPPYEDQPPPYTPYPTQPPGASHVPPYPPAVPGSLSYSNRPYTYAYLDSSPSEYSSSTSTGSYNRTPDQPDPSYYGNGQYGQGQHFEQTVVLKERRRDSETDNTCLLTMLFALCCCCLCVD